MQDRQAAVALAKRVPASPKARRRSLKAAAAVPHTEPLMAARRAERELKARVRQLEEESAVARAAAAEERSRSAALREGVRRAQEMRRAAERQRDDAVAAAAAEHKAVGGLRARVKTLQASLEQVRAASCTAQACLQVLRDVDDRVSAEPGWFVWGAARACVTMLRPLVR